MLYIKISCCVQYYIKISCCVLTAVFVIKVSWCSTINDTTCSSLFYLKDNSNYKQWHSLNIDSAQAHFVYESSVQSTEITSGGGGKESLGHATLENL